MGARKQRAVKVAATLVDDIDWVLDAPPSHVVWIEGTPAVPVLKGAPIDVAEVLKAVVVGGRHRRADQRHHPRPGWANGSASTPGRYTELDVGSPFDYEANALLYCAAHLPDPRSSAYEERRCTTSWPP